MAMGDSRIVIPTKVDYFDPGYFSKIFEEEVRQQNEFDPDYVSKILEAKQKEEIKDPGHTSKTEERLAQLAEKEALFALRRSSYQFPARPPYYKPNSDSEEELADLYMTREEWKAHLDQHPGRDPTALKIIRYFECVEAGRKGELPPRKSPQPKSDDDSDYLSETDSVGCLSGIYATRRLAEESGGGFNREINPNFTRDMGFTVDDDDDIYINNDDFTDDEDDYADDEEDDDEDDDGLKDEIVVNSGTSSAPAA